MQRKSLSTELLRWRRQNLYAFPNETQTNSCNKRPNNIMQAPPKVLPQTPLYTDIARLLFTSRSNITRSRAHRAAGWSGSVFMYFLSKTKINTNFIYCLLNIQVLFKYLLINMAVFKGFPGLKFQKVKFKYLKHFKHLVRTLILSCVSKTTVKPWFDSHKIKIISVILRQEMRT